MENLWQPIAKDLSLPKSNARVLCWNASNCFACDNCPSGQLRCFPEKGAGEKASRSLCLVLRARGMFFPQDYQVAKMTLVAQLQLFSLLSDRWVAKVNFRPFGGCCCDLPFCYPSVSFPSNSHQALHQKSQACGCTQPFSQVDN